jgi:hypothetical protein
MENEVTIDLSNLYQERAKLADLPHYLEEIQKRAGQGQTVVLTGPAPVWLYLKVAHALHGVARRLVYRSPVAGDVEIFNHSPY